MPSPIHDDIQAALAAVAKRESLANVFFVACGGSFAQMHTPKYVIDRESADLNAETYNAAEFVARDLPRLGAPSLVILASTSGETPETVAAAQFARARGAYTIGLTTKPESALAKAVDCAVRYVSKPQEGNADGVGPALLRLAFGLLRDREGNAKFDALTRSLQALPDVVSRAQAAHGEAAQRWAQEAKREPVIYTLASGPNYGVSYSFSICILQEMQWIHTQAIHAGEYFHGPFEITDDLVPFIVVLGHGACRTMDQRALDFTRRFTDKILTIDIETLDLAGIDPGMVDYLQPLVLQPLLRIYAIRLSEMRGHPLTVRRYMWAMEY